ncbi:hypothetical protein BV20DRAFT_957318, partial [Pilatotrama ljubarskyi]
MQPCILLALLMVSALHTLSGLNSDAANLVLGIIRVVLTGAFIASNNPHGKRRERPQLGSLTDEQRSILESVPRDIRTVLSRLEVEPDIIRYATC